MSGHKPVVDPKIEEKNKAAIVKIKIVENVSVWQERPRGYEYPQVLRHRAAPAILRAKNNAQG